MTQTAKNYAQALYELHVDAESVKTAETILKEVPEVGESLTNPTIAFHVKEKIIDRIFRKGSEILSRSYAEIRNRDCFWKCSRRTGKLKEKQTRALRPSCFM